MADKKTKNMIVNGAKIAGETLAIPGTSLLLDGKIKPGMLHVGAGLVAGALLGTPAVLAVAANSFSTSVTGKSLLSNLLGSDKTSSVNLDKRVNDGVEEGMTLEEIQETVAEDVEDIYLQTTDGNQSNQAAE